MDEKLTFLKGLLCAKLCFKCYTFINQFRPQTSPVREVLLSPHFTDEESEAPKIRKHVLAYLASKWGSQDWIT